VGRKKGVKLTREAILAEAMRMVDEEGLSGLSVRKLGARLGVQGMALYYHFTSKTAIIDALVAWVMHGVDLAAGTIAWDDRLRSIHESQRRVWLGHPNLLPAIISRPFNTPAAAKVTDVVLAILLDEGFDDKEALHACQTLRAYVLGYTITETVGLLGDAPSWDNRDRMSLPDYLENGLTHLLQVAPAAESIDHDEEFSAGLGAVIDGLRSRLAARPVATSTQGHEPFSAALGNGDL
jgi:AcrR family transcriptional regulator